MRCAFLLLCVVTSSPAILAQAPALAFPAATRAVSPGGTVEQVAEDCRYNREILATTRFHALERLATDAAFQAALDSAVEEECQRLLPGLRAKYQRELRACKAHTSCAPAPPFCKRREIGSRLRPKLLERWTEELNNDFDARLEALNTDCHLATVSSAAQSERTEQENARRLAKQQHESETQVRSRTIRVIEDFARATSEAQSDSAASSIPARSPESYFYPVSREAYLAPRIIYGVAANPDTSQSTSASADEILHLLDDQGHSAHCLRYHRTTATLRRARESAQHRLNTAASRSRWEREKARLLLDVVELQIASQQRAHAECDQEAVARPAGGN